MAGPARITGPFLDVLEALIQAHREGKNLHGWAIMKATRHSGPTIYGVLDRLEDMHWIEGHWERQTADQGGPRRRFYTLTPDGVTSSRTILIERGRAAPGPGPGRHPSPAQPSQASAT